MFGLQRPFKWSSSMTYVYILKDLETNSYLPVYAPKWNKGSPNYSYLESRTFY